MGKKKLFLACCIVVLFAWQARAEKPLAGITGIESNSPRSLGMGLMLKNHLINILNSVEEFSLVNSPLLESELKKFNCLEESCVLRFAADSGIQCIVRGSLDDRGESVVVTLTAYGMDVPFQGRAVHSYTADLPMNSSQGTREYSYITEEHAGRFLAGLLSRYRYPVSLSISGNSAAMADGMRYDGKYEVYRYIDGDSSLRHYVRTGSVTLDRGSIIAKDYAEPRTGDFILARMSQKGTFLETYYYGRKKEIVLRSPSLEEQLFIMLLTPLCSASMPAAAPILGYYWDGDWPGLSLWALNAAPYISLEIMGFLNRPEKYYRTNSDVSRSVMTMNHFAWYMLVAGGGGLFVDAFAQRYLSMASEYRETVSLMGSPVVAGYLALVTGGGGHFYRGYRAWGYLYFHLDSLLMYGVLYELSPSERYDSGSGRYVKGGINRGKAAAFISALAVVKTVEIVHAVLLRDRIWNGSVVEEGVTLEPLAVMREDETLAMGMQVVKRF